MAIQSSVVAPLIDVDDAKLQLNIPLSDHTLDSEINDFIIGASEVIAKFTGESTPASVTEWLTPNWATPGPNLGVYGSGYVSLTLSRGPVVSVQSVQPQFYQVAALDLTNMSIDAESATLWVPTSQLFLGPCTVVYTAGRAFVPKVLGMACRFLVQDLYVTQRGPATASGPTAPGQEMNNIPGVGMISSRVVTLLQSVDYHSLPGFA